MISLASGRFRRCRAPATGEAGFTLIELMVATGVILVATLSILHASLIGFADIAMARQRQGATALVNQTMERLRSVSSTSLSAGMNTTDLANSLSGVTADAAISSSGGHYFFEGEQIPATGATQAAPLNPHRSTRTLGVSTYTISTYLTYYQNNTTTATPTYRATVVVTWTRGARQGVATAVRAQSLFYSPRGEAGYSPTHQYTPVSQAFFYAVASSGQGLIHTSGTVTGLDDFDSIDLDLPRTEAALQAEQLTRANAKALTSGDYLTAATLQSSGGQQAASAVATNDPNQPSYYSTSTVTGPGAGTLSNSQGLNVISVSASASDTANATATTSAGQPVSNLCTNAAGTAQFDGLGCANSQVRQLQAQAVTVQVNPAGLGVVSAQIVSAGGQPATLPSPQVAYVKRVVAASGSNCTGDGCTEAKQTRGLGTVQLGAFPAGLTPPTGWQGYLVRLTGYSDSVFAQSGVSPAATTATATGTISYWNGSGYSTISYTGTPANVPAASASATGLVSGSLVQATLSASDLVTGGKSTTSTTTGCGSGNVCAASATSASPLIGDVSLTVGLSVGGLITTVLADVNAHVDLGTIQAQTSYRPAP